MHFFRSTFLIVTSLSFAVCNAADQKELTLHQQVDALLQSTSTGFEDNAAPLCDDATFIRRVMLDLTATIPTADRTRRFLADKTPMADKRTRLITQLLGTQAYARRMQYLLDWILMERRTSENVASAPWEAYLRKAARENRSWSQLAQEILADGGADPKTRPRSRFYLDRDFDLVVVTRDVGRIFLGKDLECAQCHNHPAVESYLQRHYHGLRAFLDRSYLYTDAKTKKKSLGEKAEGDVTFTSVFDDSKGKTDPRVLDLPGIPDPAGTLKQYVTKPGKTQRGVPKYSRRGQLGVAVTADSNRAFRLNIANRLWAAMMGRGLVEPLDLSHADNPPTHPELLDLLGDALHEHDYDMRWFLGELVKTRAYQRGREIAEESAEMANRNFAVGLLKPLSPEQYAWSTMEATGFLDSVRQTVRKKIDSEAKSKKDTAGTDENASALANDKADATSDSESTVEEAVDKAVAGHIKTFIVQFASDGGQRTSFSATAPQALFLINGPLVRKWLTPNSTNLTGRLSKLDDSTVVAEELYIAVLNRQPNDLEKKEVADFLASTSDRSEAIVELTRVLLLAAEFRFNH
jgi:hypothetical protein